jgi:hypothetical protein
MSHWTTLIQDPAIAETPIMATQCQDGVCLRAGQNQIHLTRAEIESLIAYVQSTAINHGYTTATPAKARLMRYPVSSKQGSA